MKNLTKPQMYKVTCASTLLSVLTLGYTVGVLSRDTITLPAYAQSQTFTECQTIVFGRDTHMANVPAGWTPIGGAGGTVKEAYAGSRVLTKLIVCK